MKVLGLLLLLLVPAVPAWADEPPPSARAFVETHVDVEQPFVGQVVTLRVRFGLETAWFDAHAVPLFRRAMDLPVQIAVPWAGDVPGLREARPHQDPPNGERFVLGDEEALARQVGAEQREGRSFLVYEWARQVEPVEAGPVDLGAPVLHFAYATRFEEDFVGGRVALDRRAVRVPAVARTLSVRPLPTEGRPAGFTGAVGRFEVSGAVDESGFPETGSVRFALHVRGEGNLHTFGAPALPETPGLHVLGVVESRAPKERTFRFELAPTSSRPTTIPAVSLPFFDPRTGGGYRSVQSRPIPLSVRGTDESGPSDPAAAGAADAEGTGGAAGGAGGLSPVWLLLIIALAVGLAWLLLHRSPSEDGTPDREEVLAAQAAAQAARRMRHQAACEAVRAAPPGAARTEALIDLLALHLGRSRAAVIRPDLASVLQDAGVPASLACEVADVVHAHVAARYGAPSAGAPEPAPRLLERLYEALGIS